MHINTCDMRAYADHACLIDMLTCEHTNQNERSGRIGWLRTVTTEGCTEKSDLFKNKSEQRAHRPTCFQPPGEEAKVSLSYFNSVSYQCALSSKIQQLKLIEMFLNCTRFCPVAENILSSRVHVCVWDSMLMHLKVLGKIFICLISFSLFSSQSSYPVWEDFSAKATKLHSQLRWEVVSVNGTLWWTMWNIYRLFYL